MRFLAKEISIERVQAAYAATGIAPRETDWRCCALGVLMTHEDPAGSATDDLVEMRTLDAAEIVAERGGCTVAEVNMFINGFDDVSEQFPTEDYKLGQEIRKAVIRE